jgi:hypothetical protein
VLAVIFDDMKGLTFFGLSPIIVNIVQNIGVSFTVFQIVGAFGFPLALIILSAGLINFFAPHTLVLPEPVIVKKEKEVSNNIISRRATINFNNLFNLLVFRYKALWRPILITTGMASLFILLLSNEGSVIVGSLVIITPLIVGMSFGVNMFGVIGNANGWFVSQPYWRKTVLWRLLGVQLNIIGLAYLILLTPSLLFGRLSFVDVVNLLPAMTVIALVMSVFGVYKSTVKPVKYSPSQRGDNLLPPTAMLSYMVQLLVLGLITGGLVLSVDNMGTKLVLALVFSLLAFLRFFLLNSKWNSNEKLVNRVIQTTSGD